ncbi:hypothetical protein L327_0124505 [Yersinia pestis S3]|nr:hypothetical protein L327_0124505 [Yersinia pestis S3]
MLDGYSKLIFEGALVTLELAFVLGAAVSGYRLDGGRWQVIVKPVGIGLV